MRILLTANASYVPPRGGSTRSNLVWLEYLASRGHDCRVVAPALRQLFQIKGLFHNHEYLWDVRFSKTAFMHTRADHRADFVFERFFLIGLFFGAFGEPPQ